MAKRKAVTQGGPAAAAGEERTGPTTVSIPTEGSELAKRMQKLLKPGLTLHQLLKDGEPAPASQGAVLAWAARKFMEHLESHGTFATSSSSTSPLALPPPQLQAAALGAEEEDDEAGISRRTTTEASPRRPKRQRGNRTRLSDALNNTTDPVVLTQPHPPYAITHVNQPVRRHQPSRAQGLDFSLLLAILACR